MGFTNKEDTTMTKLKRLTITMDEELEKRIRTRQANLIKKYKKSFSFSTVCQILLDKGLKAK